MNQHHFDQWSLEQARELAGLFAQAHENLAREIENRLRRVMDGEDLSARATLRLRSLVKHIEGEVDQLASKVKYRIKPMLERAEEFTREEIATLAREPQWSIFEGSAAAEYVRQGTMLEQHMESTLAGYSDELLSKVKRILNLAVIQRHPWNHMLNPSIN